MGQRVALLLARQHAEVRLGSRDLARSAAVCQAVRSKMANARVEPVQAGTPEEVRAALGGCTLVINAAAAGVMFLPRAVRTLHPELRLVVDLNAVLPLGIEGVELGDRGVEREGVVCYGALGVGDTKMKVHKAAVARLFERNDQILDAEEVYALAQAF